MIKMRKNENGFTLTEMAVVLIVIGLLIGGILQAGAMIKNMQITRTISDVRGIKVAAEQFEKKYGYMPGDFAAVGKVPDCNASSNCASGDENGAVGGVRGTDDTYWTSHIQNRAETVQFWKHLTLADMMTGVNGRADPVSDLAWTETHPAAPVGGGFEFYYDAYTTIGFAGHIVRLSLNGISAGSPVIGTISPAQAAEIDRKMDDGEASNGKVFANYGNINDACKTDQAYNEASSSANCILYFVLFR